MSSSILVSLHLVILLCEVLPLILPSDFRIVGRGGQSQILVAHPTQCHPSLYLATPSDPCTFNADRSVDCRV
ncbi:hypothetical protein EV421DRAFT_1801294 [Armillaria borealis]|uniref:Secreted protein n=1 Tax=Armillaria borealis TaxID=47425 RepID=A0AA39JKL9_9AGAR|nr:hypothetical protein EV421DRAFT_1801294 [Armillaria borealis]